MLRYLFAGAVSISTAAMSEVPSRSRQVERPRTTASRSATRKSTRGPAAWQSCGGQRCLNKYRSNVRAPLPVAPGRAVSNHDEPVSDARGTRGPAAWRSCGGQRCLDKYRSNVRAPLPVAPGRAVSNHDEQRAGQRRARALVAQQRGGRAEGSAVSISTAAMSELPSRSRQGERSRTTTSRSATLESTRGPAAWRSCGGHWPGAAARASWAWGERGSVHGAREPSPTRVTPTASLKSRRASGVGVCCGQFEGRGGAFISVHFPLEHMRKRTSEPPLQILPSELQSVPRAASRSRGQPLLSRRFAHESSSNMTEQTSERMSSSSHVDSSTLLLCVP